MKVKLNSFDDLFGANAPAASDQIVNVALSELYKFKISGDLYSQEYVKSKFLRLTSEHVMYVMDCIKKTPTKIKAYLMAALFNAPSTIGHYYQQEVKHYTDSDVQKAGCF